MPNESKQWTDEQYLIATSIKVSTLKSKVEQENTKMLHQVVSPFQQRPLPCEEYRLAALKCYEDVREDTPPRFEKCFASVKLFHQCANTVLQKHLDMSSSLEPEQVD